MEHKLFTREVIADFIETSLKQRLVCTCMLDRWEVIEKFDIYAQYHKLGKLRMYSYDDDCDVSKRYYDRQADLINILQEYGEFRYISAMISEGYYKLKFYADPLNLPEWEKFISCIRGEK